MSKPRVVVVTLQPPLPFGNAAARWYYVLVCQLTSRGYQLKVISPCKDEYEKQRVREVLPQGVDVDLFQPLRENWLIRKWRSFRQPFSYTFSSAMRAAVDDAMTRADILHVEQLWTGWLALPYIDRALINVHHLQTIDLEDQFDLGPAAKREVELIRSTEKTLIQKFRHFRTCSPRLDPLIHRINPDASCTNVPVGMDNSLYKYQSDDKRPNDRRNVFLIGQMGWYPSASAAKRLLTKIWPRVKEAVPNATLSIVGWDARRVLSEYVDMPDVSIEQDVPEIQPYFDAASVMVYAPARGSGMKIKVLEAMLFGVPVVTTSEGAEGMPFVDGEHGGLAEADEDLVARTINLLVSTEEQNRVRANARQLAESYLNPISTVDQIEACYDALLGEK